MIERTMDIVIFAMSTWAEWHAGTMNRNAHVVRTLAMHPRVRKLLVVDYLPYDRRRAVRTVLGSFHHAKPLGPIVARGAGWTTYRTHEKVAHVISHMRSTNTARVQQMVDASTAAFGMERPWYWSYVPFTASLMDTLHGSGWVYDIVDDWTTHASYQRQRQTLEQAYQTIDARADVVFTVSEMLRKHFPRNRRVTWVPNAVDPRHFQTAGTEPAEVTSIARPFAVYAGIIESRIDIPTIEHLAIHMPELPLVFVGPVWPLRFRWLRPQSPIRLLASRHRSVVLLGQKSYDDLPRYLSRAAVGLIPHRVNAFTRTMDPLKLYEYLASGIPVVSTGVPGPERFPVGVDVAQSLEAFTDAVRNRLRSPIDAATLRELVRRETWSARVDQMLEFLA